MSLIKKPKLPSYFNLANLLILFGLLLYSDRGADGGI